MADGISITLSAAIVYTSCLFLSATSISLTFAQVQEQQLNILDNTYTIRNSTNGTSLDVKLQPIPYPLKVNEESEFIVSFLKPGNDTLQDHVDFNLRIVKDNE
ncbi:MAG: hypothetical protein ACRD5J_05145 [Nitrososphaeraceae archaeon]